MNPVSGGWTSHKIRGDGDFEAKKRAAIAQADPSAFGVQQVIEEGVAGDVVRDSRTKYGNVNVMPNDVLQSSTFAQRDAPGNQDQLDIKHRSGSMITESSSTNVPQQDPDAMETDALSRRLSNMAKGGQGFPGLNNRNREV